MGKYRILICLLVIFGLCWRFREEPAREVPQPEETVKGTPVTPTEQRTVEFPYVIRDAELIAEKLTEYEGSLPGVDNPVDAAALMIFNPGKTWVASAVVTLVRGDDVLHFFLTNLPPASRVLVVEKDGKPFAGEPVTACGCLMMERAVYSDADGVVLEEAEGQVLITNGAEEAISVRIHYQSYYAPAGFYLGGVDRWMLLENLQPGEERKFLPPFYAPGYTKVIWIEKEGE